MSIIVMPSLCYEYSFLDIFEGGGGGKGIYILIHVLILNTCVQLSHIENPAVNEFCN